jgi:hypothetical protein
MTWCAERAPAAGAANPEARFPVDGRVIELSRRLAVRHWRVDPCQGEIELRWLADAPHVNATAAWKNAYSPYGNPEANHTCRITLNHEAEFTAPKLCSVIVHEYGHLAGHMHSDDPRDVMAPAFRHAFEPCAGAFANTTRLRGLHFAAGAMYAAMARGRTRRAATRR